MAHIISDTFRGWAGFGLELGRERIKLNWLDGQTISSCEGSSFTADHCTSSQTVLSDRRTGRCHGFKTQVHLARITDHYYFPAIQYPFVFIPINLNDYFFLTSSL